MRADNSRYVVQAAQRRSQATRDRAVQALRRLVARGDPITFDSLARTAGVSRSWLYAQPDLRLKVARLRARQRERQGAAPATPPVPARQRASDASLRRRLEAVNAEIRRLREENRQLREQLAWALGERRAAALHGQTEPTSAAKHTRPTTIGPCS
ncbi:MAG TPA: DUF6262 family protein [Actinomycetes bacterium]|jgi:hypothetical protein|nr:DUF6262 family protein [Actinomycetes bacterium]